MWELTKLASRTVFNLTIITHTFNCVADPLIQSDLDLFVNLFTWTSLTEQGES